MITHDLASAVWTVRPVGAMECVPPSMRTGVFPARVPGCVHTDLIRAGAIPDPRVGFNENMVPWVGETDWEYRGVFRVESDVLSHERIDLVCEGLDTIAEVSVNGRPVGAAANMFHPHRFDLRGVLNQRGADNEIVIVFRSPLKHIRAERERLGALPHNGDGLGWEPYPYIRKAACNFGWDWAPRVATCGVSAPLRLEGWSEARLGAVRAIMRFEDGSWILDVSPDIEFAESTDGPSRLSIGMRLRDETTGELLMDSVGRCASSKVVRFGALTPRLWWPATDNTQALCHLEVSLIAARGHVIRPPEERVLDRWISRVAFRQVRLNCSDDEYGTKFQIEVNGKPVFCKGANWIPEGLFPDDRSPEKIRERVRQAAAANINMLRVWGGGAYECNAFYDECDRQGIMVWQDFMFACACYPEHPEFVKSVETEARYQIARLSSHPSVVLWCGGNECVWGRECWGHAASDTLGPWKERTKDRPWSAGYWYDLLPRLLRELDPTRPYWPNSPCSTGIVPVPPESDAHPPNDANYGTRHTWDAPPGSDAFKAIVPRFCTEFGQQSPAHVETLAKVAEAAGLRTDSEDMHHRQRGTGGMAAHIEPHLNAWLASHPDARNHTFEDWVRNSQAAQADALKAAIEWLAANRPRCMGALVWQFNDAWPGMSWSLIDSEGKPKPAYFAVRDAFAAIR